MESKFQQPVTLGTAVFFISTALYAYRGRSGSLHELTFLSNFLSGVFLSGTFLLRRSGKKVPQILYFDCMMLLFLVLIVCAAFTGVFKFNGMFFCLHMLNPLLMILYYFLFCDMNRVQKTRQVLSALAAPILYLVFAAGYGKVTGDSIYFFLNVEEYGYGYCVSFAAVLSAVLVIIGCAMFFLNRIIHSAGVSDISLY
ncbi:Pr6Pr family membrane protein [Anaerostipes caccae]|uniref:Pr6Pr family membrane protein n=1 Tax=Anaerostipes caccae TaxID=105841 RepID=UPI0038D51441